MWLHGLGVEDLLHSPGRGLRRQRSATLKQPGGFPKAGGLAIQSVEEIAKPRQSSRAV